MLVYLIRHAIAVKADEAGTSDAERPLTRMGIQRMRQCARGLVRLGVTFDAIWTSPLVRARSTADLVAREFSLAGAVSEQACLKPGADLGKTIEALRHEPKGARIALVGHEPHLGQLATYLLTGLNVSAIEFKKGATACIEIDSFRRPVRGKLLWLLTPRQLRRIRKPA